ncbi:cadherin domain protein [Teladorsagia circumcincta]|uniref:Cadherin domain protein n=1 Tax=Teladorsagia circumcincta TaxID=45464 RepID=A0A2G9UIY6_TELCI|nr:cadherin domain protein [Teladorsagia circumcincta]
MFKLLDSVKLHLFGPATYSIVGDVGLSVDRKTGMITTATVFDHEERQLYSFKLKSSFQSGEFFEHEAILVIDDENDNMPRFDHDRYSIEIAEDVQIGTEITRLRWTDHDFNNAFHLSIIEGNELGHFEVDSSGLITIAGRLDRERLPTHRLVVRLSDGVAPFPYHTTDTVVVVTLRDVNDNAPIFESSAEFLVEENSHRMKVIGRVKAVDADEGQNAVVHYRILPESLPQAEFIIDAVRGDIMVNKPLDFETIRNYTFSVAAMDYGTPKLQSIQQVAARGTSILRFEIDDADCDLDSGENGLIAYSVFKGNATLFSINSASGELLVLGPLDREDCEEHFLTVQAIDSGSTRLHSTAEIKITVLDDNDNAPEFDQPYYAVHVRENTKPGQKVLQVKAIDNDQGQNAVVRYSILEQSPFLIDKATGEIRVVDTVDREVMNEYRLTIQAMDSGRYRRLTSTAQLTVFVDDENDNSPIIRNKLLDVFVTKDLRSGE